MRGKNLLTMLVIALVIFSLTGCKSVQGKTDKTSKEPKNAEEAVEIYKELLNEEQGIFAENVELWEKVYMQAEKGMAMLEDGKNYGDFLLDTIDSISGEFTAEELKMLREKAVRIGEIENRLTQIEEKYPETPQMALDGYMDGGDGPEDMRGFPEFVGKDLEGNKAESGEMFSANAVTVVNLWFTTCSPCVGELSELDALDKELSEKGGEVIGINAFTLDGDKKELDAAKKVLDKKGAGYRNIYFDSDTEAGEFIKNIYAFPTTYVVNRRGDIVGEPIVGAITDKTQNKALKKLIDKALREDAPDISPS